MNKAEIESLDRKYRLNLINSISGIKPANLIGTKSKSGIDNLAIFSSVVHLGSNPALLGMISRPNEKVPRDTFTNIQETEYYTINHVSESLIESAHLTSAKFDGEISEFEALNIEAEEIEEFYAPFVKESPVKIGMKLQNSITLPNGCMLIIGEVILLQFPDEVINRKGQLDLSAFDCAGISGLNTYYRLQKLATFPYARVADILK